MAVEIIMPKLGVDMQEGEILKWKKAEGDVVNEGDILLEIMSDKTNMEIEADDSGVLLKIVHPAGDVVPVTEVIGSRKLLVNLSLQVLKCRMLFLLKLEFLAQLI